MSKTERNIYIVIHRQTVSLYHNSSMRDALSLDQNATDFTLIGYLTQTPSSFSVLVK